LIARALRQLPALGRFISGGQGSPDGQGYSTINLQGDSSYDDYLRYKGLDDLLERMYVAHDPSRHRASTNTLWIGGTTSGTGFTSAPYSDVSTEHQALKRDTAFVLMPINPNNPALQDVYETIKEVFKAFGVTAYRADDIQHQDRITEVILGEIETCEYVIADLSFERPNVYYEIGYAHALGKKPILIRKAETTLHFDLSVHNVPEYRNITELRELLRKRLGAIFGRDPFAAGEASQQ
jgi:nucleoside 2-deoxyribosyltransferase